VRHSTTVPAEGRNPKFLKRTLGATVAFALVASGLSLGLAAPASAAASTQQITGATLAWGFNNYNSATAVGAYFTRIGVTGNAAIDDSASISGFTVNNGAGVLDAEGDGIVYFEGGVQYRYLHDPSTNPWTFQFSDFELEVDGERGSLSAVVTGEATFVEPAATGTRVVIANFDVASSSTTGSFALTTAAPDYAPAGAGTFGSWPTTLVDAISSGGKLFFYSSSGSVSQQSKKPLPMSVTGTLSAAPATTVAVTSASVAKGVVVSISGERFRAATRTPQGAKDAGIYVGIAPSGALPDVSTQSASSSFLASNWIQPASLTTGSFATTLTIPAESLVAGTSYSVYTWQAHSYTNITQDTETPFTISKADTKTSLSSSAATAVTGTSVTLSATVSGETSGTVAFYEGTTKIGEAPVVSGVAVAATPALAAGTHAFTAVYSGDLFYNGSTSTSAAVIASTTPVVTTPAKVTTTLTTRTSATAGYGQTRTIKAIATPLAEGTVSFTEGTTVIGTATLVNGVATLKIGTLKLGSHSLVATYAGSATASAAVSPTFVVKVNKLSSVTTVTAKKFTKNTKPTVTVKVAKLANGKYATGKVRVYVGGKSVKLVTLKASAKGKIVVTLPSKYSKTISVKAKYFGSTNVAAKTSSTLKLGVK
jgi:hypothetical protein